ncbi:gamma-glutamylcyclotransferase [bacterium]|nr:gamma-glutamylcyclotransferase [bacterium]MCI0615652.1 gamma-glutamylcyclotransferase [bacterium]
MRKIDVFFYGLFMDEELLRMKGVVPTNLRSASVDGFQLRIGKRATLVPMKGSRVYGIVAELTHDELQRLYSEPSVRDYQQEAILAYLSSGEAVAALCFNLPDPPDPSERNSEYALKLRTLAERLQFPNEYIASI